MPFDTLLPHPAPRHRPAPLSPLALALAAALLVALVPAPPLAAQGEPPPDSSAAGSGPEAPTTPGGDDLDGMSPEEKAAALEALLREAAGEDAAVAVTVGAAPTLRRWADAIDRPRIGARVEVGPTLRVGRATLEIPAATPVRLLLAGEVPAGVVVDGPATFVYRVEDRFSIPVCRRNLGEGAHLSSAMKDGVLEIREPARSAAVWSWTVGTAAAAKAVEGSEERDRALPAELQELVTRGLYQSPANTLLIDRGVEGREGMAYVLVHGQRENLLLSVDPVVETHESLSIVTGVSRYNTLQRGLSTTFSIADQPIGRQWWEREEARSPLVLTHQKVSVVNPEGRRVVSTSTSTVTARRGGVSVWFPWVDSEFYGDEKLRPLRVEAVKVNGEAADFLHRGHQLLVDLGGPLAAGRSAEVEVVLSGDLAIRPNNDSYWRPAGSWRPSPGLDAEYATFELEMKVPEPYIPFASGDTVERTSADGFNLVRTRIDLPVQFPVVAAGKYHVFSEERDGLQCNVASYVFGKEKPAEVLRGLFFSGAQIFEQYFGVPYPFDEVDVVEINQWGWGQAPAGVIFITQEAYNPIGDTLSRLFSGGVNARFVHEVAHAWWGHVIKMDSAEEQWLTESFADYAAALAMQAMLPGKRGQREFDKIVREWKAFAQDAGEGSSIYLANYLDSRDVTDDDHNDRYRILYNKGPLVLHALRQELGRQTGSAEQGDRYFQALLRTFTTNFQNQYGETRHLVGILNQMTGRDWQPWFEKYVYGTETPPVEL